MRLSPSIISDLNKDQKYSQAVTLYCLLIKLEFCDLK